MRKIAAVLCVAMCVVWLVGCSSMTKEEREAESAAQEIFLEVQTLCDSGDYDAAAKKAKTIVTEYAETAVAEDAQAFLEEYALDLLEQEKEAYAEENWSAVISFNNKIITAVPHSDIAEESQEMAGEAHAVIDKQHEEKEKERKEQQAILDAEQEKEQQELLSKFRVKYDQVEQITWYHPSSAPQYINNNSCYIYMGKSGNDYPYYWLRWVMSYAGNDWIFFDNVTISVDGTNYYKSFDYFDVTRDNNYGGVWEYVDIPVEEDDLEILNAIADSDQTIIRFQGDTYRYDKTVTQAEKAGIRAVLDAYDFLK